MSLLGLRFLRLGADTSHQVIGSYDPALVLLSIVVASVAAYAALLIQERMGAANSPKLRRAWLAAGAVSMGMGIWCMHFVGMLALRLPFPVRYDPWITLVSLVPGVGASAIALHVMQRKTISFAGLNLGGILMGAGIGAMHYTGMAAMIMPASMAYSPLVFALSILVAHVLATFALFVKFVLSRRTQRDHVGYRAGAALLMGGAVAGMHYTGMAAAHYFPRHAGGALRHGIDTGILGDLVLIAALGLLLIAMVAVMVHRRLERAALTIERLLETAPDAIVTIDPSGRVSYANAQAGRVFGYARDEMLGQPAEMLVPASRRKAFAAQHSFYLRAPSDRPRMVIDKPLSGLRKDGSEFPVEISLSHERTAKGVYVMASIRDVSDRQELEQRIRQSEKLSAIGQLAAGVAHEINNPLGVILGFAQGMESRMGEDDALHLPVTSIVREALRCKNLVQELLTFSRTEKKTSEDLDLNELVRSTVVLLEARARTQGVEVVQEIGDRPLSLRANRTQLQQIIVNLGTNAMDAMLDGGTLTLRTRVDEGGAVLEVQDTGTGIPEAVRARIFDPFFTTKDPGKGTGLGLSLVHEIVVQHGGRIVVDSGEGGGTTMAVRLPGGGAGPEVLAAGERAVGTASGGAR